MEYLRLKTLRCFAVATAFFVMPACWGTGYQLYLDGEDSEFRVVSGNWAVDKTGSYQGNYRFSVTTAGGGGTKVAWDIDAIPDGTYFVEYFVDNGDYAQNVQYVIEHATGETVLSRPQNFVGTGWHEIGTFAFSGAGRITQSDALPTGGKKIIADALRITYQGTPSLPDPAVSAPPEVSIVVDDLGALNPLQSNTFTYQLFNQAPQISYAVLPFLTYSTAVLQDAASKGIETMLHQPFQYIGQPDCNPGDSTRLYLCMTPTQILNTLNTNLSSQAPYIWGFNNHQGSRFSQHRPGLEVAIQELKDRVFYYLDSRTVSDSIAYDIAREKGVLTAERDLFVDESGEFSVTKFSAQELVESVGMRAMYAPNYSHIMICHQRPTTVPGLLAGIDTLETSGIAMRRLDHNLHYIVETDHVPVGASVEVTGNWTTTHRDMISHECFDGDSLEAANTGTASVTFRPNLPKDGMYRVFVATGAGTDVSAASVTIDHRNGATLPEILPQAANKNRWIYLDSFPFLAGTDGTVTVSATGEGNGKASADAVKFVYDGEIDTSAVSAWPSY